MFNTRQISKGISPLIAAVMLMAFTIATGAIFAQWSSEMFESNQQDTSEDADKLQSCSQITLQFMEKPAEQEIFVQQKSGDSAVGEISATWHYPSTVYQNTSFINQTGSFTNIENPKENFFGNVTRITVDALNCSGTNSITRSLEED